eukprot:CAMPEP_0185760614 /NCGR_PEP_ID=MMETSP1174-20130828/19520_1 /TAXON_ID=35687 /ORGANISM="Dictyocha speculum, Strain CCMP1381" /LENGTH=943 /DNA_ID=CAMNT_0028441511 /DNA_START=242 /DNA_END=3073 /DNA_ORIENTATION=-
MFLTLFLVTGIARGPAEAFIPHMSPAILSSDRGRFVSSDTLHWTPVRPGKIVSYHRVILRQSSEGGTIEATAVGTAIPLEKDKKQWDQLYTALEMYKIVNGDLRVPSKFIVPESAPWDQETWGLKLGVRVSSIRNTGRFVKDRQQRIDMLDALGFEWKKDKKEKKKDPIAPSAPPSVASGPGWEKDAPQKRIGEQDLVPFDALFKAIMLYKEIKGDVKVPTSFVVPAVEPWPISCHGMPIGACVVQMHIRGAYLNQATVEAQIRNGKRNSVTAIPGYESPMETMKDSTPAEQAYAVVEQRRDALTDLGIDFHKNKGRETHTASQRFQRLFRALCTYRDIHGHVDVPQHFVIPDEAPWDEDTWGLRLGSRVNAVRSQGTFVKNVPERRDMLTEIGFRWEQVGRSIAETVKFDDNMSWQQLKWAQDIAAQGSRTQSSSGEQRLGDMRDILPGSLLPEMGVDSTDAGSSAIPAWVTDMDYSGMNQEQYPKSHTFSDVVAAIKIWSNALGHMDIPYDFTVPFPFTFPTDPSMDEALLEIDSDPFRHESMSMEASVLKDSLDDIDAMYSLEKALDLDDPWEDLSDPPLPASSSVDEILEEDQLSAADFAALEGIKWPNELGGLPLGYCVEVLRSGDAKGKYDPVRRKELNAIGFTWGEEYRYLHFEYNDVLRYLVEFKKLFSDLTVPHHLVIPSTLPNPYPSWMHGVELGKIVNIVRAQKKMIEKEYPERYSMLLAMEFTWLPPVLAPTTRDRYGLHYDQDENDRLIEYYTGHHKVYKQDTSWAYDYYRYPGRWEAIKSMVERGKNPFFPAELPFTFEEMLKYEEDNPRAEFEDEEDEEDEEYEEDEEDESGETISLAEDVSAEDEIDELDLDEETEEAEPELFDAELSLAAPGLDAGPAVGLGEDDVALDGEDDLVGTDDVLGGGTASNQGVVEDEDNFMDDDDSMM